MLFLKIAAAVVVVGSTENYALCDAITAFHHNQILSRYFVQTIYSN